MPPKKAGDLADKQGFVQEARSEISSRSSSEERKSAEEAKGSSQPSTERSSVSGSQSATRSSTSQSQSQSSSQSQNQSKDDTKPQQARRRTRTSSAEAGDAPEQNDTETTPLISSTEEKTRSKSQITRYSKKSQVIEPGRPWGKIVGGLCLFLVCAIVARNVYLQWCVLGEWGPWSVCEPSIAGAPRCEYGVHNTTRPVIKGNCASYSLGKKRTCWMGRCEKPDLLLKEEMLPCNAQSRRHILKSANFVYGRSVWSALSTCQSAYLCCYPCVEISSWSAPLRCHNKTVPIKALTTGNGCISCFAALGGKNSGLTGCGNGELFCQLSGGIGSATDKLCCFSAGPQEVRGVGQGFGGSDGKIANAHTHVPTLGPKHFDRHSNLNAFIGIYDRPGRWPHEKNEAHCQLRCWHDAGCHIYTFVGSMSGLIEWRGRCVSISRDQSMEMHRDGPNKWLDEHDCYSGVKAPVSYSKVLVTIRTSAVTGSSSQGPFELVICANPEDCTDHTPIVITDTSCRAGEHCLAEGRTSTFVGEVPVPIGFMLHRVVLRAWTQDEWTIDRLVVDYEGLIASHHSEVQLGGPKDNFSFPVGCVTEETGFPCVSDCFSGDRPYGWCYTVKNKTLSGDCVEACKSRSSKTNDETMQDLIKSGGTYMSESAMSCAELNWPTTSAYNSDESVCGSSRNPPLAGCSGWVTWRQARDFCEDIGARLCTQKELEHDEAAGTGCGLDQAKSWSSTFCREGDHWGYKTVVGASAFGDGMKPTCSLPDVASIQARCCADSRKYRVQFTRAQRDAGVLPKHMMIPHKDVPPTWQIVEGIDYAGENGLFLQSGIPFEQRLSNSESVEVRLDNMAISARGGRIEFYFRIDSEPGQDELHFYADGREQTAHGFPVSGKIKWTLVSFSFPSSPDVELHNFSWIYSKDTSMSVGEDIACLDHIVIYGILANG